MKPLTRKEMLLDGAAKGNLDTFKPATREEVFAKRALANAGGSGGSAEYDVVFKLNPTSDEFDSVVASNIDVECDLEALKQKIFNNEEIKAHMVFNYVNDDWNLTHHLVPSVDMSHYGESYIENAELTFRAIAFYTSGTELALVLAWCPYSDRYGDNGIVGFRVDTIFTPAG